jgi:hypothetical protein
MGVYYLASDHSHHIEQMFIGNKHSTKLDSALTNHSLSTLRSRRPRTKVYITYRPLRPHDTEKRRIDGCPY